ncbi:uncharacterized protein ALTATR162_LOCUS6022 [Alternaria atra]|uniref:Uncharacterized protein n=1 Tax=Alternaria atra TaxID=119953 RepID=A0A8J2IB24_9PLEO|nr:uncharacterized protein ALTATR162_LOCUS6022 [Alternaria atra]CAG5161406.1 unnamed protein product [Alternaria atra]
MSQDTPLAESRTDNSNFGLNFTDIQHAFESQHQMTLDAEDAQWSADSGLEDFNFSQLRALGNKVIGLDNVFGCANKNDQLQHSVIRQDEPTLEQLIAQDIPSTPPPPYQPFQHTANAQQDLSHAHTQDDYRYVPPNPPAPELATKLASARGTTHGLAFQNLAEAKKAMLFRHLDKEWFAPISDDTIPTNDEERAAYVVELLEAMKDTSTCSDRRETPAFVNRWTRDAVNAPHPEHMEKVCWQLVDVSEHLHINGPVSLPIYDKQALATARKSRFLTFAQRMDQLCALLRLSKSRCFSLLKGENLETTVAAPAQRYSGTIVNCAQNDKRQEFIEEGRSVWKKRNDAASGKTQSASVDAEEYFSSEDLRGLGISVGRVHTGGARQDIPTRSHAFLPASSTTTLKGVANHTQLGSIDGGTVPFNSFQVINTLGSSHRGSIDIGQYESNQHVDGSPYYASHTTDSHLVGVTHLLSCDVPQAAQTLKRTARDAQLDADADFLAQRPCFDGSVHRSNQS